jgi:hypothetical protein
MKVGLLDCLLSVDLESLKADLMVDQLETKLADWKDQLQVVELDYSQAFG